MARKPIKIPNTEKDINFARELAAHGATNRKLAEIFGISLPTQEKWLRGDSKFTRAIKKGRATCLLYARSGPMPPLGRPLKGIL